MPVMSNSEGMGGSWTWVLMGFNRSLRLGMGAAFCASGQFQVCMSPSPEERLSRGPGCCGLRASFPPTPRLPGHPSHSRKQVQWERGHFPAPRHRRPPMTSCTGTGSFLSQGCRKAGRERLCAAPSPGSRRLCEEPQG